MKLLELELAREGDEWVSCSLVPIYRFVAAGAGAAHGAVETQVKGQHSASREREKRDSLVATRGG